MTSYESFQKAICEDCFCVWLEFFAFTSFENLTVTPSVTIFVRFRVEVSLLDACF